MPLINTLFEHLEPITQVTLALGLGIFAWLELQRPRRPKRATRWGGWQTNLGLYVVGVLGVYLLFDPLSKLAIQWGGAGGWGGLAGTDCPFWLKLVLGILLIDLFQYLLHLASHYVPWWWRLHRIHHSDTSVDASTAIRHHPLEVLLNSFLLVLLLKATGVAVEAILLYGLLQLLHGLFCHANLALPTGVDRWLRWFIITPDMHVVHHSLHMDEGNSNFGTLFPWWDRLLRSYCAQPQLGNDAVRLGVSAPSPGLGL